MGIKEWEMVTCLFKALKGFQSRALDRFESPFKNEREREREQGGAHARNGHVENEHIGQRSADSAIIRDPWGTSCHLADYFGYNSTIRHLLLCYQWQD